MSSRRYPYTGRRDHVPPPVPSPPRADVESSPDTYTMRRRAYERAHRHEFEATEEPRRRGREQPAAYEPSPRRIRVRTPETTRESGSSRRRATQDDDLTDRVNRLNVQDDENLRARFDRKTTSVPRTGAEPRISRRNATQPITSAEPENPFLPKKRSTRTTAAENIGTPVVPKPQRRPTNPIFPGYDPPGYAGGPPEAPNLPDFTQSRRSAPRSTSVPRQGSQPKPKRSATGYPPQAGYQRSNIPSPPPVSGHPPPPPQPPRRPPPGFEPSANYASPPPMPGYTMPSRPPMSGYPPPPRQGPMPGFAHGAAPYEAGPGFQSGAMPGYAPFGTGAGFPPGGASGPSPRRAGGGRHPGHSSRRRRNASPEYIDIVPEIEEPESESSPELPQKLLEYNQ